MKKERLAVVSFLERADDLLIVSHENPDGDAISSTLAASFICQPYVQSVTLVNASPISERFSFLPGIEKIQDPEQVKDSFTYVLVLDSADRSRIGNCEPLIAENAEVVNIDHHATNDHFGKINIVRDQAAATCEILYDLAVSLGYPMEQKLATCLFTGLSTDTGGFQYANTSAKVLRQAAELVATGVEVQSINDHLYAKTTLDQLKVLRKALSTLTVSENGPIAWMSLSREDYTSQEDIIGLVNYTRNIEGVEVGILFREEEKQQIRVNFRSKKMVDVAKIAQIFGGGGHARAAGCSVSGDLKDVQCQVIQRVEQEWRNA